jgi:predicted NBD/HSP70 family sugar kinase
MQSVVHLDDAGIAQSQIRRRNLSRMLFELHLRGPLTRSALAARLRLNRSTVASLIAELASRDLVWERTAGRSSTQSGPGRPSPLVEICPEGPAALGLELSTDWIRTAVIDLGGHVVATDCRELSLARLSPPEVLDEAHVLVASMLGRLEPRPRLAAMGVSIPGAVRASDGFLHHAPNLGWTELPLGSMVEARFAHLAVPVTFSNDAVLAAWSEHARGSGQGTNDFICLWGEAGIGAGVVVDGRPMAGAAGYAGEAGHMTIRPDGLECYCGSRGCWETEVGERALLRRAGRDPEGGTAAVSALLAAAGSGDPKALAAIAETGRWLGIGIASLVNIFNPSRVALGGLYARVYPYARDALMREIDSRALRAPRAMVELTTASLGPDALLHGAAELALGPILRDPTIVPLSNQPAPTGSRPSSPRLGRRSLRLAPGGDRRTNLTRRFSLIPA